MEAIQFFFQPFQRNSPSGWGLSLLPGASRKRVETNFPADRPGAAGVYHFRRTWGTAQENHSETQLEPPLRILKGWTTSHLLVAISFNRHTEADVATCPAATSKVPPDSLRSSRKTIPGFNSFRVIDMTRSSTDGGDMLNNASYTPVESPFRLAPTTCFAAPLHPQDRCRPSRRHRCHAQGTIPARCWRGTGHEA